MLRRGRRPGSALLAGLAGLVAAALVLAGCSGYEVLEPDPGTSPEPGATVVEGVADGEIGGTDAASRAIAASRTFFSSAALVVLTADTDDDLLRAGSLAVTLGVPALVVQEGSLAARDALVAELERLEARTVLVVGDVEVPDVSEHRPMLRVVPAPVDVVALQVVIGHDLDGEIPVPADGAIQALADATSPFHWLLTLERDPDAAAEPTPDPGDLATLPGLPSYVATVRGTGAVVVTQESVDLAPAVGTARAAGADVVVLGPSGPPTMAQAGGVGTDAVLTLGEQAASLGSPAEVAYLTRVAAARVELPGGGLTLLPGKEYVALRGLPGEPDLGPVGDGVGPAVDRLVRETGALDHAVPTLELATTVAIADPGPTGSYSAYQPLETLRSAVAEAREAGAMVLLSFQPGRETFIEQLEAYAELLAEPNVGILLEPQWRLGPEETPEEHSGAVGDDEVVAAATWLADFTLARSLPPKLVAVRSPLGPSAMTLDRVEVALVVVVSGAAVVPEVPTPEGADPAVTPPVPAVTAAQVWSGAVVDGPAWWGWDQGENAVPLAELLALDPEPVLITLR